MTTNSRYSYPQWARVFRVCDASEPHPVAPPLQGAETARNTLDVDMKQQLRCKSAGGNSRSDVPLLGRHCLDVSDPDVPLPDAPLLGVTPPVVGPDSSVGDE
jgi:hypothetical protein